MPASDCSWTTAQQLPAFQVYATKRKCNEDGMEMEEACSAQKRMCLVPESSLVTGNTAEGMNLDHHISQFQHEQNQMEHVQVMCFDQVDCSQPHLKSDQKPCQPDTHLTLLNVYQQEMNNNETDTRTQLQSHDLMMDLNDETYSIKPGTHDQHEDASAGMDSDYVPDQRQYNVHANFCKDYCGYGSISPRSGNIRCYCKPSWEGMLEVRPYVSDIY